MCWIACQGQPPAVRTSRVPHPTHPGGSGTPRGPANPAAVLPGPPYLNDGVQVLPGRGDCVDDRGRAHGDHGDVMGGRRRWNDHGGVVGGRWGSM